MNDFLNTQVHGFTFVPGCGRLENPVIQRVDVLREKAVETFGKATLRQLMEPPLEMVLIFWMCIRIRSIRQDFERPAAAMPFPQP